MTPSNAKLVKFIGAMFNAVPGAHLGTLEGMLPSFGGDVRAMMHSLSFSSEFQATLPVGATDREIAYDLVNRIVGEAAAPAEKEWAVAWMADQKAGGSSWGEIVHEAVAALDGINSGAWAKAADQMRARADYAVRATEKWAVNVGDLGTIRDVYSYANAAVPASYNNLVPLTRLDGADAALASASAGLGAHAGSESYIIGAADQGKALLFGAGAATVTVSYGDLLKPVFVSGGDGQDTLVIRNTSHDDYNTFNNTYSGVLANLPYRGFEKIVFEGRMPVITGSFDGARELSFTQRIFETKFGSVDNGTVLNIDLVAPFELAHAPQSGRIKFFEFAPYNRIDAPGGLANPSAGLPQLVDTLTFNIKAGTGTGGSFSTEDMNVRHLTWNVTAINDPTFTGYLPANQSNLETLKLTSNVANTLPLTAPSLRAADFSGSTGEIRFQLTNSSPARSDGYVDSISIKAPQGLFGFRWDSFDARNDTYVNFEGEFKAGSNVQIQYSWARSPLQSVTKVVFNSDFSEVNKYFDAGLAPFANTNAKGSLFQVAGSEKAAVYFKGVPASGQTIGTVSLQADGQTTTVKVDSGHGIDVLLKGGYMNGVLAVINNGQGSVLDNVKASVASQLGMQLNEAVVAGGRILWAEMYANGKPDGIDTSNAFGYGAWDYQPWASTPDFVMMETSNANLAQFNQAIGLLGFNPVVDYFA